MRLFNELEEIKAWLVSKEQKYMSETKSENYKQKSKQQLRRGSRNSNEIEVRWKKPLENNTEVGKKSERNEQHTREIWDEFKMNDIRIIAVSEEQEGKSDKEPTVYR